jgi:hypothetical protein
MGHVLGSRVWPIGPGFRHHASQGLAQLFLESGAVARVAFQRCEGIAIRGGCSFDLLCILAGHFQGEGVLHIQDLVSRHSGSGHQHEERDMGIVRGHHGRDDRAFAVADQADPVRIPFRACFQVRDAGLGVTGEVGHGSALEGSFRFANATLVGPQHLNAFSGEKVGENQKRAMTHQAFVAVVRLGPADQQPCGEWPCALRDGQGSRELDARGFVVIGDFFFAIGIRFDRILRPALLELGGSLYALEHERERVPSL